MRFIPTIADLPTLTRNGYKFLDWFTAKVDGEDMGDINSYTFKNVRQNHTVSVTFEKIA